MKRRSEATTLAAISDALAAVGFGVETDNGSLRNELHSTVPTLMSRELNVRLNDRTNTMTFVDFDAVQKW